MIKSLSLESRKLLPLLIVSFLTIVSDNYIRVAFLTEIAFYSKESGIYTYVMSNMITVVFILPFIFFSSSGGKIADYYEKASLIQYLSFSRLFLCIFAIAGFITNSYTLLLASLFTIGIQSSIFNTVKFSIVPDLFPKEKLNTVNGYIEATIFLGILIGTILAGITVFEADRYSFVSSICITIFTILGFVASTFIPKFQVKEATEKPKINIVKDCISVIKLAFKKQEIALAILGISWFWLVGAVLMSQLPNFTQYYLYGDKGVYIFLLSCFTIGAGVGSVMCNRILKGIVTVQYVPISMLMMAIFALDLWFASTTFLENPELAKVSAFLSHLNGWRVMIDVFFISFFGGMYIVPLYSYLMVNTERLIHSQIIAANNIVNSVFMVVGSAFVISLYYFGLNVSDILFIIFIANFCVAIYICKILPHTVIQSIFQFILKIFYRVEVRGIENFHKSGKKTIIIANHASLMDPMFLGVFIPSRLTFAIDTMVSKWWWLKPFLSFLKAFPVDPTNPMSIKTLIQKINQGETIAIFPEGRLTSTGSLMKIYDGPGIIADKTNANLLPIRLDGVERTFFTRLKGKYRLQLFPKITITIMPPRQLAIPSDLSGIKRRNMIGQQLYDIMADMMFTNHDYSNLTLVEKIIKARNHFGGGYKILQETGQQGISPSISYNSLLMKAFIFGRYIRRNSKYMENVGILLPNTIALVSGILACMIYLRVPALLNYVTGSKNVLHSCEAANIKTVYTSRKFIKIGKLEHIIEELQEANINIVYLEDVVAEISIFDKISGFLKIFYPLQAYQHMIYKANKNSENNFYSENSPAVILFTSGSEGKPKGVALSHANIIANIRQISSKIDFNKSDRLLMPLPIFHTFGFSIGTILPLCFGVHNILYPTPLHYRVIPELIYYHSITTFISTDRFLSGYANYADPYDFSSVRYIFAGAEKLRKETSDTYMEQFGIRILEGYGATETSPVISLNTNMHYKKNSVGRLLPGIKYVLEKVDGIKDAGKLILKGDNVMLGYLKTDNPGFIQPPSCSFAAGTQAQGWYDTGDIVSIDNEGYITIEGRLSRFVKKGGEMVSLALLENITQEAYPNFLHAIVSLSDETVILLSQCANVEMKSLIQKATEMGYTPLHVPNYIYHVQEIPVLNSGKVDYVSTKQLALEMRNNATEDKTND